MTIETEPRLAVFQPSTVRICDGRLLFGARSATEFKVVPAVTKTISMPDSHWFKTKTVIGGSEFPYGIDLGEKKVDGADWFNAFGFELWHHGKNSVSKFTIAQILGDGARDIHPVEQLELDEDDISSLYKYVALGAMQDVDRLIFGRIADDLRPN